ncbi:helix-turn-helix transcriptional regulator [Anaerorhabdus sp.]|uniref:helix-turn-helix transcriptional regulator n=1 Tax=Anaerorhabdus sp. TaxID=1872524 RepID=UPI002FCB7B04
MFETVEVIERQKKFDELLRKKYGNITLEEFADKVEVNRTIARNYYYGGNVTMKTLDKIASGLGVKVNELL